MDWLDRLSAKKGVVGIEILPNGLALAAKGCFGTDDKVDFINVILAESDDVSLAKELDRFVQKQNISKRLCHLVLHPLDYQLLLVEAPDVPDHDMREAIRWRVKDLISVPVDQAIVDVFSAPNNANRGAKKMIYVVVSEKGRMQELVSLINDSGLKLSSIDIGEMAMRNLSVMLTEDDLDRGVGIVRLSEGGGVVSLYRGGNLYLSRQFQLKYNAGLLDDLPIDALGLEVQRSLDYYERQMGLTPPALLYLCGENISEDKITDELKRSINVPSKFLDLNTDTVFNGDVEEGMVQVCLGALGAAFREVASP